VKFPKLSLQTTLMSCLFLSDNHLYLAFDLYFSTILNTLLKRLSIINMWENDLLITMSQNHVLIWITYILLF